MILEYIVQSDLFERTGDERPLRIELQTEDLLSRRLVLGFIGKSFVVLCDCLVIFDLFTGQRVGTDDIEVAFTPGNSFDVDLGGRSVEPNGSRRGCPVGIRSGLLKDLDAGAFIRSDHKQPVPCRDATYIEWIDTDAGQIQCRFLFRVRWGADCDGG